MQDFPLACLIAGALSVVGVFVTSEIAAEHSDVHLPRPLVGESVTRRGYATLIVESLWVVPILGVGEVVMLLALIHPESSLPVRIVSAAQLMAAVGWLVFLGRRISQSRRPPVA